MCISLDPDELDPELTDYPDPDINWDEYYNPGEYEGDSRNEEN